MNGTRQSAIPCVGFLGLLETLSCLKAAAILQRCAILGYSVPVLANCFGAYISEVPAFLARNLQTLTHHCTATLTDKGNETALRPDQ